MDFIKLLRAHTDRALATAVLGGGILALTLGYVGVSSTAYTAEQIPYVVSGGILGLFLLGLAAVLYLSADLHDEWRKLDDLERQLVATESALTARTGDSKRIVALEARLAALESPPKATTSARRSRARRAPDEPPPTDNHDPGGPTPANGTGRLGV